MKIEYYFYLKMTSVEFLPYYQGHIKHIIVTSTLGKTIQFPAMHIRKFLTSSGIQGKFCMKTENNKFISLNKL